MAGAAATVGGVDFNGIRSSFFVVAYIYPGTDIPATDMSFNAAVLGAAFGGLSPGSLYAAVKVTHGFPLAMLARFAG